MAKEKTEAKKSGKSAKTKVKAPAKKANAKKNSSRKSTAGASSLTTYFKDVRLEMKRVTWPSKDEVFSSTALVLAVVAFFIVYVGVVDQILIQLLKVVTAALTGGQ